MSVSVKIACESRLEKIASAEKLWPKQNILWKIWPKIADFLCVFCQKLWINDHWPRMVENSEIFGVTHGHTEKTQTCKQEYGSAVWLRVPPAVSTLMPISLLNFWLCCAPNCVYTCSIHRLWLYSCPVISQGPDKRLFACFEICVETNQPRYRLQDGSWPNHKKI